MPTTELQRLLESLSLDVPLHGRRKITTNHSKIDESNVLTALSKALAVHNANTREITYLYDVYRGIQDILRKEKCVREEINNIVLVNIPNEIVTFKTAFFLSGPIQYVMSGDSEGKQDDIKSLNDFMRAEDKESKDKELCDWFHICGVAPIIVMADEDRQHNGSPACIYTLDPRSAFNIYYAGIGGKKLASVIIATDEDDEQIYNVYTTDAQFVIKKNEIVETQARTVPYPPIVEYLNNEARIGAFEMVLSILNAINVLESNRVDSVQEFVNAYDVFQNCEIQNQQYAGLAAGGQFIQIASNMAGGEAKVYRISSEINQAGVQTAIDDLVQKYLSICGMPGMNTASSASDTGQGVIYRQGWVQAESRANDTEKMYNRSEREMLEIYLYICREKGALDLEVGDLKIEHSRNNLSNLQSRVQILCEMLASDDIHPKIPWMVSGLPNSEEYYRMSMEYKEENQRKMEESLRQQMQRPNSEDNQQDDVENPVETVEKNDGDQQ